MSLFSTDEYQWRETYFVLFASGDRPQADAVSFALANDGRFEVSDIKGDDQGQLESLTLKSPDDFSAMDISFVSGEEVTEQVEELLRDLANSTLSADEREKLDQLAQCDARFDVFHFEQVQPSNNQEQEEFLDPGGLLIVMEQLAQLCAHLPRVLAVLHLPGEIHVVALVHRAAPVKRTLQV